MSMARRVVLVLLAAAGIGAACASGAAAPPAGETTILVSIDGFRWEYLSRGLTPTLAALAATGVSAPMRPAFPSVTWPNHFTLLTGLYPDRHGIVDNHFEDRTLGKVFDLLDPEGTRDPAWWTGGVPIWASAQAQGIPVASMFWLVLGTDAQGRPPARSVLYQPRARMQDEPAQVLDWLDLPEPERPRLILLYFYDVDRVAHEFGVHSDELAAALRDVDAALGTLVEGLRTRRLFDATNLIVVSDHGMTEADREHVVALDDLVDLGAIRIVSTGAVATLEPRPGFERAVARALLGRHGHVRCWRRERMPRRFHYGTNPRIAPIVCLGDLGWEVTTRSGAAQWPGKSRADHGFDPDAPDMAALFVAHGPGFRAGVRGRKFPNVDIYPMVALLSGVKPEKNDGRLADVRAFLKRP